MKDVLLFLGVCFILSCWIFVVGHILGFELFLRLGDAGFGAVPIAYSLTALTSGIVIAALIGAVIDS